MGWLQLARLAPYAVGIGMTPVKKGRISLSGGGIGPKHAASGDAVAKIARFLGWQWGTGPMIRIASELFQRTQG